MNLVIAIIKPYKLDDVRESLNDIGISGMTVTEVKGFGRQQGRHELYRGAEYDIDFVPKVKIEIAAVSDRVEQIIEIICKSAKSGEIGDGKIFVLPLSQVIRIRTGEQSESAI